MSNMVLWVHLGAWMGFVVSLGVCKCSEYSRDTQGSEYAEYARVRSWIMLEHVWICLKQSL